MASGKKDSISGRLASLLSGWKIGKKAGAEAEKSLRFLFLAFFSLIVLFVLSGLVPLEFYELFVANTVLNALNAGGIDGIIHPGEPVVIELAGGPNIVISYLCTGLLEVIVLASVIIASLGIPINKRIIGVALGTAAAFFVNLARILATIYFLYSSSAETVEFFHDIFFRLTLFITIFLFYAIWFRWAIGGGKRRAREKKAEKNSGGKQGKKESEEKKAEKTSLGEQGKERGEGKKVKKQGSRAKEKH